MFVPESAKSALLLMQVTTRVYAILALGDDLSRPRQWTCPSLPLGVAPVGIPSLVLPVPKRFSRLTLSFPAC